MASTDGDGKRTRILLAGESWVSESTHFKGWDGFQSVVYQTGIGPLRSALEGSSIDLTFLPGHEAADSFPFTLEELQAHDAVVLSDLGANTLLLPSAVWLEGRRRPNRLKVLRDYVRGGGGFAMIGGYMSFQGINGVARYRNTPVAEILPVGLLPHDDRLEVCDGFRARVTGPDGHPILAGIGGAWPHLLGANEVTVREDAGAEVLARLPDEEGGHPLLVTGRYGEGRTLAWMSDMGPHWAPPDFLAWEHYATLWIQMFEWLGRAR